MSTSGLLEVGLADWPVWFRRMNPGYFAAEVVNSNSNPHVGRARGRRGAKSMGCTSANGNGGACCGSLHGPGGIGRESVRERERERRSDRLRAEKTGTISGRERGADARRGIRSEELGEQIIASLRDMSREHVVRETAADKASDRLSSASLVERAAARDTKNWEDETDDEDNAGAESVVSIVEKEVSKGKGKLVDV